jgi:2,4-dienoyl-CoA reductase-like NADH-dependent reductase (Old Yellow Enzyme family)
MPKDLSADPLLQLYRLKHPILKNRIKTATHGPAYPEGGMPKDRSCACHAERARVGIPLVRTAAPAPVAYDSPPVFNNILTTKYGDVPWVGRRTDARHKHGCAMMFDLTHRSRRNHRKTLDWLPAVSPGYMREAAFRTFKNKIRDLGITRILIDFADSAGSMQAAGFDGIELQACGYFTDRFWSERTNWLDGHNDGSLGRRLRFTLGAMRECVAPDFMVGTHDTADKAPEGGITQAEGLEISRQLAASGPVDFMLAAIGAHVAVMTLDRSFAPDWMAIDVVPHMRASQSRDVRAIVTCGSPRRQLPACDQRHRPLEPHRNPRFRPGPRQAKHAGAGQSLFRPRAAVAQTRCGEPAGAYRHASAAAVHQTRTAPSRLVASAARFRPATPMPRSRSRCAP